MKSRAHAALCRRVATPFLAAMICLVAWAALSPAAGAAPLSTLRWSRVYAPTAVEDIWKASAIGADGSLYVAGTRGQGLAAGSDVIVARYSRAGDRMWLRRIARRGHEDAVAMALDRRGNAYVAAVSSSGGSYGDVLVYKVSSAGAVMWTAYYTTRGDHQEYPCDLKVDRQGNVYVLGYGWAGATRGDDLLLLKYAPSGKRSWRLLWDNAHRNDWGMALVLDPHGTSYVTGISRGTGPGEVPVLRVSPVGAVAWSRVARLTSTGIEDGRAIAVRGSTVAVAAEVSSTPTGNDAWTLTYDTAGAFRWAHGWDQDETDLPLAIAIDAGGAIYVSGWSEHSVGGPAPLSKGFLLKRLPSGSLVWAQTYWDTSPDQGRAEFDGMALGPDGSVYCAGYVYQAGVAAAVMVEYSPTGVIAAGGVVARSDITEGFKTVSVRKASDGKTMVYCAGQTAAANGYADALAARYLP